jgi:hypothetical protein
MMNNYFLSLSLALFSVDAKDVSGSAQCKQVIVILIIIII